MKEACPQTNDKKSVRFHCYALWNEERRAGTSVGMADGLSRPPASVVADHDQHNPYEDADSLFPTESLVTADPNRIGQNREQEDDDSQSQDCPVPPRSRHIGASHGPTGSSHR